MKLFWDSSYSLQNKELSLELSFLEGYFKENPEIDLELVKFSNELVLQQKYAIRKSDWTSLKNELMATVYDGTTVYGLLSEGNADELILVTDGRIGLDKLPVGFVTPLTVVSSSNQVNQEGLKTLAVSSKGTYHNLKSEKERIQANRKLTIVSGIIKDENGPLSNVKVRARNSKQSTLTDAAGAYEIEVNKDEILEFSRSGKNTVIARVPDSGKKDLLLTAGTEVLEEVVVKADTKEELVETGNGQAEKKRLGYAVQSISEKDVGVQDITVENAVSGQFSNVTLNQGQNLGEFIARGRNMSILLDQTGLIVVDGVPIESSPSSLGGIGSFGASGDKDILSSLGINPNNIKSVSVLKGLAATNKYGTLGRNGVLIITTKTASADPKASKKSRKPLGTTPTYEGDAELLNLIPDKAYLKELKQSSSIDQAYEIYLKNRKLHGNEATYFFEVADYFKNWNNPILLNRILSNVLELPIENSGAIRRALAYKYEQFNMPANAADIYRITNTDIQGSRNAAQIYTEIGNYNGAKQLYNYMTRAISNPIDRFAPLKKTIENEFKNLVALHSSELNVSNIKDLYKKNVSYNTRIVFEWNAYDAEFDLQIVNPQNRFYTWSHSEKTEASRFKQEQESGYGLEEFFITESDKGTWLFNVNYLGKRNGQNNTPTYFKVTTYRNYGKKNQTRTVQVFPLYELNKKSTLLKIKI